MRQLKFRMWDDKLKTMYTPDMEPNMWNIANIENGVIKQTKDNILMQYIGLKDKNKKEIYEGDFVKYYEYECEEEPELNEYEILEVKYCADISDYPAFEIDSKFDKEANRIQIGIIEGRIEVIGNIYENPELSQKHV